MAPPTDPAPAGGVRVRFTESLGAYPVGRVVGRILMGLARIELVDRAMTLAAQMFTSVLPVLIAVGALVDSGVITTSLRDRFSVFAIDLQVVPSGSLPMNSQTTAFGVMGVLMVMVSGTSFARALGRMYGRVWDVPGLGLSQAWRWFVVLFTVAASIVLVGWIRSFDLLLVTVAGQWCVWACVWAWCPRLLTVRAVPGHVLWATGAVTATLLAVVDSVGRVVMPRAIASSAAHFGVLGIVFAGIGWLFVVAVVLVASPVVTDAVIPARGVRADVPPPPDPSETGVAAGKLR